METTGSGILVVNAINGATTVPGAFALEGEARAGAFDYDLFRGGVSGSANSWFLRSDFIVPPGPEPEPPVPGATVSAEPSARSAAARTPSRSSGRSLPPTALCSR